MSILTAYVDKNEYDSTIEINFYKGRKHFGKR